MTSDEPRAVTAQELRDDFMDAVRAAADFWADPAHSPGRDWPDRVRGALHSILCVIDGVSGLPAFDLAAQPHPDDKQFHIDEDENWIEPGTVINSDDYLHDRLYERSWAHLKRR